MNRRSFITSLLVALLGAPLAAKFGLTSSPKPTISYLLPGYGCITQDQFDDLGMSIRYITKWDKSQQRMISRMDVLYGVVSCSPGLSCLVISHPRLTRLERVFDPMRLPA